MMTFWDFSSVHYTFTWTLWVVTFLMLFTAAVYACSSMLAPYSAWPAFYLTHLRRAAACLLPLFKRAPARWAARA